MTDDSYHRVMKLGEWEREGRSLFGDDKLDWQFQCPSCKRVTSAREGRRDYKRLFAKGWNPASECLGRYVKGLNCKWAAYGVFRGPWFIKTVEGQMIGVFPFASVEKRR